MDSFTNNNGNFNNGNNKPHKPRSNASFGQAAVAKQDVGDFQSGYFVMVDTQPAHQQRPKTHKTPERHSTRKSEQTNQQRSNQQQRERSTNKDIDQQHQQQREGDMHGSQGRITTSPHRSPTRNKRSPSSQIPHQVHSEPIVPTSPHKPRKAHMDSGSPPKDKPSPSPNRWAGPAFSNAPPPSSLPLPDFPPFQPSSPSSSPSSSPPQSGPAMFAPPTMYHENIYIQPPLYNNQYNQPQFSYQFVYADIPSQPTLAQLSVDLRKMLHIGAPIPA